MVQGSDQIHFSEVFYCFCSIVSDEIKQKWKIPAAEKIIEDKLLNTVAIKR